MFDLSRYLILDQNTSFSDYIVRLDLSGDKDIMSVLLERKELEGFRAGDLLRSLLPYPLAMDIIRRSGTDRKKNTRELNKEDIEKIAGIVTCWEAEVRGARGWKMAQCTKGGVPYAEINEKTMESRRTEGLYITGELMDYDGPCGGYNLQNEWETGMKAGRHV